MAYRIQIAPRVPRDVEQILGYIAADSPTAAWLPIILTTAFVIVGAWRREVRDAAVEPVAEDAEE